jgi:predicted nucleic acid-binding Zn ribbon protein
MLAREDEVPSRLGEILDPLARKVGMDGGIETARVWSSWSEIVGKEVAEHAEPTSLRGGVLRVRTDSPVWATELGYLSEELRGRVNERLGRDEVKKVKVWTGPGSPRRSLDRAVRRRAPDRPKEAGNDDPVAALKRARAAWVRARKGRR